MESFREFIVPITIFLVAIWVAVWKEKSRLKSLGRKINEDSYQRYAKFYGNTIVEGDAGSLRARGEGACTEIGASD